MAKAFPVLHSKDHSDTWAKEVPWEWIQNYEERAKEMHGGQSLERLAERGGLTWTEIFVISTAYQGRHWTILAIDAHREVMKAIKEWEFRNTGFYSCDRHKMSGIGQACPACRESAPVKEPVTVWQMRQQSAMQDGATKIQVVTRNRSLQPFLEHLRVVAVYPDTVDRNGNKTNTFKIEVDVED